MRGCVPVGFLYPSLFLVVTRALELRVGLVRHCEYVFAQFKGQAFVKRWKGIEGFIEVELEGGFSGDVGCLLVKASMNEYIMLYHEAGVSKSIDIGQFIPI